MIIGVNMCNKQRVFVLFIVTVFIFSVFTVSKAWGEAPKKVSDSDLLYFEDYIASLEDEPEDRFHKAREAFFKNDMSAGAKEIRKAVAFLRVELVWATEEGKKGLLASAIELDRLADEMEQGNIASVKELDDAFSRAHYALAKHYQLKSAESNIKKAYKKLVIELKAAAKHLNYAILWSGNKIESGFKDAIKGVNLLEDKLIKGSEWIKGEADKSIELIGREIEKLNKKEAHDKK